MSALNLPERTTKKRSYGITSIQDVRLTIGTLQNLLRDFHFFIDIAKIGIGTAYVNPVLDEKLKLYKKYDVAAYFGGTLFEKYYYQSKLDEYLDFLESRDMQWLEISNGTVDISLKERADMIRELSPQFNVLAEVGCKDSSVTMPPSEWIREIEILLDAGATYVITEGRDSGSAGIYTAAGTMRTDLISDIVNNTDARKLIFETPNASDQMYMINQIGTNVNLGNIVPEDVLLLETQRMGLRSETFYLGEKDARKS